MHKKVRHKSKKLGHNSSSNANVSSRIPASRNNNKRNKRRWRPEQVSSFAVSSFQFAVSSGRPFQLIDTHFSSQFIRLFARIRHSCHWPIDFCPRAVVVAVVVVVVVGSGRPGEPLKCRTSAKVNKDDMQRMRPTRRLTGMSMSASSDVLRLSINYSLQETSTANIMNIICSMGVRGGQTEAANVANLFVFYRIWFVLWPPISTTTTTTGNSRPADAVSGRPAVQPASKQRPAS